jgi:dTDP-4-dehydrorhamnose 3,5-epimerase
MKALPTPIPDLLILDPTVFKDSRGYFFESYNSSRLSGLGINAAFLQDNQSKSQYGVIRGLHFQKGNAAQTKLIRVLTGIIYDVAVDLRPQSSTFGKWFGIELSEENNLQLYIPKGFAHGFSVLSENATILYKCDEYYNKNEEGGIKYNDLILNIDWRIPANKTIISEKDQELPSFEQYQKTI